MNAVNERIARESGILDMPQFRDVPAECRDGVIRAVRQAVADEKLLRPQRRPRLRVIEAAVRDELENTYGSAIALAVLVAVITWVVPKLLDWLLHEGRG